MPIWNEDYETLPLSDLQQLQLERLQAILNRVYLNVAFYRQLFDRGGIAPEDITALADLAQIPFTTKETLRENQPYGMFALPLREVVRLQTTSGTTGEPIVVGYSQNDLENWTELVARMLTAGGVSKDDVVQIAFDYGLFTGALGFHYGAEKIGATVIPCSRISPEKQLKIMRDYRTTVLICTPTCALQIAEAIKQAGVNPAALTLRLGLFGAEPWSETIRDRVESALHIRATDNYGLSEIIGPGVSGECEYKDGLHIAEDHFIPEIINPTTGETLQAGEKGELVLTTITKEAFPMIRYRTGDLTRLDYSPCLCGRTSARMAKVMERTDDMLLIRGINVFPSQIEHVLKEVEGAEPNYRLVVDRSKTPEELEIWIEVSDETFFDEIKIMLELKGKIQNRIEEELGFPVGVKLVEPQTIRQ